MKAAEGHHPRFTSIQTGSQGANFKEGGNETLAGEGLAFIRIRFEGFTIEDGVEFHGSPFVELRDVLRDALGIGGARGRADQRPAMHRDRISARV